MAMKIRLEPKPAAPAAKIRNPVGVPVLMIITLGIYGIYWWYQINREMVDLGRARNAEGLGDNAFHSLLAVFPGFLLIVPPYVSFYRTVMRIQRAQEVAAGSITLNGMLVLWLIIGSFIIGVTAFIIPGYIQAELNKAWNAVGSGVHPDRELEASAAAGPAVAPAAASGPAASPGTGV